MSTTTFYPARPALQEAAGAFCAPQTRQRGVRRGIRAFKRVLMALWKGVNP